MSETGSRPVRPPLRSSDEVAPAESPRPAGSERPQPATAVKAPAYARRKRYTKQAPRKKQVSETFTAAKEMTARAAHDIRRQFGEGLTREECLGLVSAFRAGVVPRRRAGRRPKAQVTAAYLDWKSGMRGAPLCLKHIPGWEKHNRYRRMAEEKRPLDAIRSRSRRMGPTAA